MTIPIVGTVLTQLKKSVKFTRGKQKINCVTPGVGGWGVAGANIQSKCTIHYLPEISRIGASTKALVICSTT